MRAYLARIAALNKSGPGLNAVTQINPEALQQAADSDYARAHGKNLGPAMGLPILLKDIIDATPMYTSAGDWALRDSYPPNDSGVAKQLKAHGVDHPRQARPVRVGQQLRQPAVGLQQPDRPGAQRERHRPGPERLLARLRRRRRPPRLAALTIGTETVRLDHQPVDAAVDVGLRPTVGLVPGYGIAPIDVSQDTAGPIVRTVTDAAITLQSIAEVPGSDPTANQEYLDLMGPNYFGPTATSRAGRPAGAARRTTRRRWT